MIENLLQNTTFEQSISIGEETEVYKKFKSVLENFSEYSLLEYKGVVDDYSDEVKIDHYIFLISGGNNGSPDWIKYLEDLKEFIKELNKEFEDSWIIEINNDCDDDIHNIYIGIKE